MSALQDLHVWNAHIMEELKINAEIEELALQIAKLDLAEAIYTEDGYNRFVKAVGEAKRLLNVI